MTFIRKIVVRYKDVILYVVFGFLTTIVNYIVYYPLYNIVRLSATISNILAWCGAVIFAFLTNKPIVFGSTDWTFSTVLPELWKFLACRLVSGAVETLMIYFAVEVAFLNGNWIKLIASVLVVILNYFASKLYIFNKKQGS